MKMHVPFPSPELSALGYWPALLTLSLASMQQVTDEHIARHYSSAEESLPSTTILDKCEISAIPNLLRYYPFSRSSCPPFMIPSITHYQQ